MWHLTYQTVSGKMKCPNCSQDCKTYFVIEGGPMVMFEEEYLNFYCCNCKYQMAKFLIGE